MRIGSMCSGYGGLDAAARAVIGGEVAWVADPDPDATRVLAHHHPDVPNLGDIKLVDWESVSAVDIVTAGYPCQPFSDAGLRLGVQDERHLWPYIAAALRVLRPRLVLLENVRGHLGRGFDTVLGDLAALGIDASWTTVRASDVGAPHQRERLIVLAAAPDAPRDGRDEGRPEPARIVGRPDAALGRVPAPADTAGQRHRDAGPASVGGLPAAAVAGDPPGRIDWGVYEPAIRRWEHVLGRPAPRPTEPGRTGDRLSPRFVEWLMGLPAGHVTDVPGISRNAQLRLLGNGVVPQQVAAAITHLIARTEVAA